MKTLCGFSYSIYPYSYGFHRWHCDSPSASDVTLASMAKTVQWLNTTEHNKAWALGIFLGTSSRFYHNSNFKSFMFPSGHIARQRLWGDFSGTLSCNQVSGHCSDVIMSLMASPITSIWPVCSAVYSDAHQSSALLAFVRESTGDRWIPRTKGQ